MHEGGAGGREEKEGRRHRHERSMPGFEGQSEDEEDGGREGHNATTIRHNNDKKRPQRTHKQNVTPRTHKLHHGHSEKSKQEGARPGEAEVEAKSLIIRNRKDGKGWEGEFLCFKGKRAETVKRC